MARLVTPNTTGRAGSSEAFITQSPVSPVVNAVNTIVPETGEITFADAGEFHQPVGTIDETPPATTHKTRATSTKAKTTQNPLIGKALALDIEKIADKSLDPHSVDDDSDPVNFILRKHGLLKRSVIQTDGWEPTPENAVEIQNYVQCNQRISPAYGDLAEGLGAILFPNGKPLAATWLNFGAFASADLGRALVDNNIPAGSRIALGRGNVFLFRNLAPVIQGFIKAASSADPDAAMKTYLENLDPAKYKAMKLYDQARRTSDDSKKIDFIRQANKVLIFDEQSMAQPFVVLALETKPAEVLAPKSSSRAMSDPFRLGNGGRRPSMLSRIKAPVASLAAAMAPGFGTAMMEFRLPNITYRIKDWGVRNWTSLYERVPFIEGVFEENLRNPAMWDFSDLGPAQTLN